MHKKTAIKKTVRRTSGKSSEYPGKNAFEDYKSPILLRGEDELFSEPGI